MSDELDVTTRTRNSKPSITSDVLANDQLPAPRQLWASSDPLIWTAVQRRYDDALAATALKGKGKAALPDLDRWYRSELPASLRTSGSSAGPSGAAPGPHISRAQLEKLVEWKLARGQWRPRLLAYAKEQPAGAVEAASAKALAALQGYPPQGLHPEGDGGGGTGGTATRADPALRSAVEALTALKGVGPATASALLAAACPHLPFMGDEALAVCLPAGRQSDYSLKAYLELVEQLQVKARQLRCATSGAGQAVGPSRGSPAADGGHTGAEDDVQRRDGGRGEGGAAAGMSARPSASSPPRTAEGPRPDLPGDWDAVRVERCLWVAAVLGGTASSGVGPKKEGPQRDGGGAAAGSSRGAKRVRR